MNSSKAELTSRGHLTLLSLVFLFACSIWTGKSYAVPGDELWDQTLGIDGFDGEIKDAVQTPNGDLYVVGSFSYFDGEPMKGIARLANGEWQAVGNVIGRGDAITLGPDSTIYVAGSIASNSNAILSWDGSSWTEISTPTERLYGVFQDIAVTEQGQIYLGGVRLGQQLYDENGGFVGSTSFGALAHFDGNTWSAIDGLDHVYNLQSQMSLLLAPGDKLYVSGNFTSAGSIENTEQLAVWDGIEWSAVGDGLSASGGRVSIRSMAINSLGHLHVAGTFDSAGMTSLDSQIAIWDGQSSWSEFPLPQSTNAVYKLALNASDELMFYGQILHDYQYYDFGILRDSEWSFLKWLPYAGGGKSAFIPYQNGVVVAGAFYARSDIESFYYFTAWDGQSWTDFSQQTGMKGVRGHVSDSVIAPDGTLYIAGELNIGNTRGGVARWINDDWEFVGPGGLWGTDTIDIAENGDLYAAGDNIYVALSADSVARHVIRWDGSNVIPLVDCTRSACDFNGYIYDIAVAPAGKLYVVGTFSEIGSVESANAAVWDGSNWLAMGAGLTDSTYARANSVLVASDNLVYVAGNFDKAGDEDSFGIARWDGSQWSSLDGGPSTTAPSTTGYALTEAPNGDIYTSGGGFTYDVNFWDGESWTGLETPWASSELRAIQSLPNGSIIAGGRVTFTDTSSGVTSNNIAIYDGLDWGTMGSGLLDTLSHIQPAANTLSVENNGTLFVGGRIKTAGGVASANVARWDIPGVDVVHRCHGFYATIIGTNANDTIEGTDGRDVIMGLGGHDQINGLKGDDVICGGAGSDTIDGGEGDDTILGGANSDTLRGGSGNDYISGGDRSDRLYGDDGNDILDGGDYHDRIFGGRGNDTITGGSGIDRLYGQGGYDVIHGGLDDDRIYGGLGSDKLYGDEGNDRIWGERGNDRIYGGAGDDSWLDGGAHNDIIYGGPGNDTLRGGDDRDRVYGQGGNDDVRAQAGNDFVTDGGPGIDSCQVAPGLDPTAINCE